MGTNYYFKGGDVEVHIGKRSAAGPYCWDCNVTLCAAGNGGVHQGKSRWLDACPVCDKKYEEESLEDSATGRELGFNKNPPEAKQGVRSCSSFTWAVSPGHFAALKIAPNLHIEDEYGRNIEDFGVILSECPIQFFDSIGHEFN